MDLGRETTDIDFSMTKMKSEFSVIQHALCEIVAVDIDDSFRFEWDTMQILSQPHMEYSGFRATLQAYFGNMRDQIHLDIGVGDMVVPNEKDYRPFEYNGKPLFVGEITMLVYPVESIFSEKLETIISKGPNNSRMKDYHDVMLIIKEPGLLNPVALAEKLHATFKHRNTKFTIPIKFDDTEMIQLQNLWGNHYTADGFKRVLARHVPIPSVKKVVILDAGGVLHPDSEFGLPNQNRLVELTGLSSEELAVYQDDHVALNCGELPLREVFERVALDARKEPKPTTDELIETYKAGITLYPGAVQMIRDLYEAGYQVVVLTNNSDIGVIHTKELLRAEGFVDMPVYGSSELHLQKPDPSIFSRVCEIERVHPSACWFVDDREKNRAIARKLGMSTVEFVRPEISATAAIAVNACRDKLIRLGVLRHHEIVFPEGLDRGKYPSEFGIIDKRVVRYEPSRSEYVVTDEPNEDGNQRKRCLYESRLAQLIVERGRGYWEFAYHKINRLFLADFDIKAEASRLDKYVAYFDKIKAILIKEGFIDGTGSYSITDLRAALVSLFEESFNLTDVSQFYYGIWLLDYGSEPLEPFFFQRILYQKVTLLQ